MNTKKSITTNPEQAYYSVENVLHELRQMLDAEIRQSLIEADSGDFATEQEVKAVLEKWKLTCSTRG